MRVPHTSRCYRSYVPLFRRSSLCLIAVPLSIRSASLVYRHHWWNTIAIVIHNETNTNNYEYMHDDILFYNIMLLLTAIHLYTFNLFSNVCISSIFCLHFLSPFSLRDWPSLLSLIVHTLWFIALFYYLSFLFLDLPSLASHFASSAPTRNKQSDQSIITTQIKKGPSFLSHSALCPQTLVEKHFF